MTLLDPAPAKVTRSPAAANSTGRRTALARWLTRPDNPLPARVMVNRLWQYHFGRGLVATPSDFGRLGERPSHPELLDWLAAEFVTQGWSLKQMHRLIMTSAAYRQAAVRPPSAVARLKDPENRLLWRMNTRRLEIEPIHDAMLGASGELNMTMGGPGVAVDGTAPRDLHQGHEELPRAPLRRLRRPRRLEHHPDAERDDHADPVAHAHQRRLDARPRTGVGRSPGAPCGERCGGTDLPGLSPRLWPPPHGPGAEPTRSRSSCGRSRTIAVQTPPAAGAAEAADEAQARATGPAASSRSPRPEAALDASAWTDFCHALLNANEFLYVD